MKRRNLVSCLTLLALLFVGLSSCENDIDDKSKYINGEHDPLIVGRWMESIEGASTPPTDKAVTFVYTKDGRIHTYVGDNLLANGRSVYYHTKSGVLYILDIPSSGAKSKQYKDQWDYRINGDILSLPGKKYKRVH